MYKWLPLMLLCAATQVLGQQTRLIRLVDDYSGLTIDLDSNTYVSQRRSTIDTVQQLLHVRTFRRRLQIYVPDYQSYEGKIDRHHTHSDTLTIRITPSEKLIRRGYEQYWNNPVVSVDTLTFKNVKALQDYLLVRLKYLSALQESATGYTCNYYRTNVFVLNLEPEGELFRIVSWKQTQPEPEGNKELQAHMEKLKALMPPFRVLQRNKAFSLMYVIFL